MEVIKKIAEDEAKKIHTLELGVVTSIYPHSSDSDYDNYECNVKLKNRELELRRVPVATQHIGFTSVPNVGDFVIIGFVKGNINAPIVLGRLYNDENRPPVNDAGEIIYESPDDKKQGVRRLNMKFPNGIVLTITDDGLKAEVGKSVVTIKTDGDITIESNAKLVVNSSGNTTITAGGDMELKAKNIKMDSKEGINIIAAKSLSVTSGEATDMTVGKSLAITTGEALDITSGTNISTMSGSSTEITAGSTAKVQAAAKVDIKGALVNIN
ncbi:phage baseplate assembly protein V [Methanooceanicella nereidis]|uniref:phage baseplate assembly protein V n=1 Tax=Methanooceanicella nereidis TaxID=2052831 RepID=UPI001E5E53B6